MKKFTCPNCGVDIDEKQIAAEFGRIGGLKTAKLGKKHFSEAGKKGMAKRWAAKKELQTKT